MSARIILASGSPARIGLLAGAGVAFESRPALVDERALDRPLIAAGASPVAIAEALAAAKALSLGGQARDALVIGADQLLANGGLQWNKPASLGEARAQLEALSGRTHRLHSAVAVARGDAILWRHVDTAQLTMRRLSGRFLDAYLERIGERALASVGAYQIEGLGIQLFERIEGDYFTILGLPLLPLLAFLRREGEIET